MLYGRPLSGGGSRPISVNELFSFTGTVTSTNKNNSKQEYIAHNGRRHGQWVAYDCIERPLQTQFYCNDESITHEVKALVVDINNITPDERLLIKLTWGIPCLQKLST